MLEGNKSQEISPQSQDNGSKSGESSPEPEEKKIYLGDCDKRVDWGEAADGRQALASIVGRSEGLRLGALRHVREVCAHISCSKCNILCLLHDSKSN
jgi:hypothetical protein